MTRKLEECTRKVSTALLYLKAGRDELLEALAILEEAGMKPPVLSGTEWKLRVLIGTLAKSNGQEVS